MAKKGGYMGGSKKGGKSSQTHAIMETGKC